MSILPFLLAMGLVCLLAAAVLVYRRLSLPKQDWWRSAGDTFSEHASAREGAYEQARRWTEALVEVGVRFRSDVSEVPDGPASSLAEHLSQESDAVERQLIEWLEARQRGLDRLTIVLFGRTKAGKSSLFSALTGEAFEGIGDGRQNVTRDNRRSTLGGVEIIDSPGISGVGSRALEATTMAAVREADVLLVQITEDRLSREDLERIDELV